MIVVVRVRDRWFLRHKLYIILLMISKKNIISASKLCALGIFIWVYLIREMAMCVNSVLL
jgi:hypothetical protein